jgi:hypothetical protein
MPHSAVTKRDNRDESQAWESLPLDEQQATLALAIYRCRDVDLLRQVAVVLMDEVSSPRT